jgi:hypothetical protein
MENCPEYAKAGRSKSERSVKLTMGLLDRVSDELKGP